MTLNMDSKVRCSACVSLPSCWCAQHSMAGNVQLCVWACPIERERMCLCVNIGCTMIPVCPSPRLNRPLFSFLQTMEEYMSKPAF